MLNQQFTNLCKFAGVEIAVLKFTVKSAKATHIKNLCKYTAVEIPVVKFTDKSTNYKPM